MTTILAPVTAKLRAAITSLSPEEVARVTTGLASFSERFPLSRLRRLSGMDLLDDLHGRSTRDSLVYWLEFKNDDDFDARIHGSIRGGSALKFVVYQSAEAGTWHTYSEDKATVSKQITAAEAVAIAERQKDELLAAAAVLAALSDDPSDPRYETLQADIEAAAPEFSHLAFFHKTLALWFPARLDDFHSIKYQNHVLISAGIEPRNTGLYSAAGHFVALLHA